MPVEHQAPLQPNDKNTMFQKVCKRTNMFKACRMEFIGRGNKGQGNLEREGGVILH